MKILVVGGTGLIGAHAVLRLAASGHQVTIGARRAPDGGAAVAGLPVLLGDYAAGDFTERDLQSFDAVVFAAGQDVRHVAPGEADVAFWARFQVDGVPDFVACAKRAGVTRVVQVGSYYHVVMPDLAMRSPYVRARQLADERARELADADFNISTLNPPAIVGQVPGVLDRRYDRLVAWARGDLVRELPDSAPPGGTNFMSVHSLAEAIEGALSRAESGAAYLVGDVNLTYRQYFQGFVDLTGRRCQVVERDEEHALLPDRAMVAGRGNLVSYEPSERTVELLGYSRDRVRDTLEAVVRQAELYLK